jgi:hypothetical protein
MSPPFGLKEPCILENAIKPHPKRRGLPGTPQKKEEELGIFRRSNTSYCHHHFGLKVPHILGKAIKRGFENPYKEQHKLSSSLCSGDWIETTPM